MNILADECVNPAVVVRLRSDGHIVEFIRESSADRGMDDTPILERATAADMLLLTADRDFGDYIFRDGFSAPRAGVVLYRLDDLPQDRKAAIVGDAFVNSDPQWFRDQFTVLDERHVRQRPLPPAQAQQP
ncbi:MAG: DUF5615 family PIN-like protein [Ktedonobacterales bacterium]